MLRRRFIGGFQPMENSGKLGVPKKTDEVVAKPLLMAV
jgi:hypothetical protein